MARAEAIAPACVELTAVLSTAKVSSGQLAQLGANETIEITPDSITGAIVRLTAGGKTIARARLRQAEDRLIATIIAVGETPEHPLDEWRFIRKDSAGGVG